MPDEIHHTLQLIMPYQYRKSPRAFWHEYNDGLYFVTVCTHNKRHYFGSISHGMMTLSEIGVFLNRELLSPSLHHPHIEIKSFVVMPNHFHVLVKINMPADGKIYESGTRNEKQMSLKRLPLLSKYMGSLKSAVSRYANSHEITFAWQERFHDRIVRGIEEEYRIMDYIENNVSNWGKDCFNPDRDIE